MNQPPQKVKCDYLSFTAEVPHEDLFALARTMFPGLEARSKPGKFLYRHAFELVRRGQPVGLVCFDAPDHQRNMLSITGAGMSTLDDLSEVAYGITQFRLPRITRVDLALDFYEGEVTYEDCSAAVDRGEFKLPKARKEPQVKTYAVGRDKRNYGRSIYVGQSPKQHRGYEKGLQIWGKLSDRLKAMYEPEDIRHGEEWGCPGGTVPELWFRSEVQYNSGDRELPPSMLVQRDEFYAGAYPFCASVLERTDGLRPAYIAPKEGATLVGQVLNARNSVGGLIHAVRALRRDLTADQILDLFDAGCLSQSIIRSGAFTEEAAQSLDMLLSS